jgi:hypothetical protein
MKISLNTLSKLVIQVTQVYQKKCYKFTFFLHFFLILMTNLRTGQRPLIQIQVLYGYGYGYGWAYFYIYIRLHFQARLSQNHRSINIKY